MIGAQCMRRRLGFRIRERLIERWSMDGSSGTNETGSINSNVLTSVNTVGSGTGKLGGSRAGIGAGGQKYFTLPTSAALETGGVDMFLSGWVKLNEITNYHCFMAKDNGGSNRMWVLYFETTSNQLGFDIWNTGGTFYEVLGSTFGAVSTATWYFLVAQKDEAAKTITVSVNGGAQDSTSFTGTSRDGSGADIWAMKDQSVGLTLDGDVDEFAFGKGKGVMSIQEIRWKYNEGNGRAWPYG